MKHESDFLIKVSFESDDTLTRENIMQRIEYLFKRDSKNVEFINEPAAQVSSSVDSQIEQPTGFWFIDSENALQATAKEINYTKSPDGKSDFHHGWRRSFDFAAKYFKKELDKLNTDSAAQVSDTTKKSEDVNAGKQETE
jgi:hypothetical protein